MGFERYPEVDPQGSYPAHSDLGTIGIRYGSVFEAMLGHLEILTNNVRNKKGKVWGERVSLSQDAPASVVNFIDGKLNKNVPATIKRVDQPLFSLEIINVGAGILRYSVDIHDGATGTLLNGQSRMFEAEKPTYEFIEARAEGANTIMALNMEI